MLSIKVTVYAPQRTFVGLLEVDGLHGREDYERWLSGMIHARQNGLSFKSLSMPDLNRPGILIFVPEDVLKQSVVEFEAIENAKALPQP